MKNLIPFLIIFCLMFLYSHLNAQVGIGTPSPHSSAILDLSGSTNKGFKLPEVNLSTPPTTPAKGLMVWNTNGSYGSGEGIYYYDGSAWQKMTIGAGADNLGNHTATENIKLNGNWLSNDGDNEGIFIDNTGKVGISGAPATRLDLKSSASDNKPLLKLHPGTATGIDFNGFAHHDFLLGSYVAGGYSQHYISFGYTSDPGRKFHIGSANNSTFSSASFVPALTVSSGTRVGINTPAPDANFEVTGTTKMFGSWTSRAANTTYQAETDGFIVAWGGSSYYHVLTDGSNPPTTKRLEAEGAVANAGRPNIMCPVKKGDYWRVSKQSGNDPTVWWMPIGQ